MHPSQFIRNIWFFCRLFQLLVFDFITRLSLVFCLVLLLDISAGIWPSPKMDSGLAEIVMFQEWLTTSAWRLRFSLQPSEQRFFCQNRPVLTSLRLSCWQNKVSWKQIWWSLSTISGFSWRTSCEYIRMGPLAWWCRTSEFGRWALLAPAQCF